MKFNPDKKYTLDIKNGNSKYGLALRYYGYTFLEKKNHLALPGRNKKSDYLEKKKLDYILPDGFSYFSYEELHFTILISINKIPLDELCHEHIYNSSVTITTHPLEGKDFSYDEMKEIVEKFLKESLEFYESSILGTNDLSNKVSVYIYDDYWVLLNKHQPRKLSTMHLDGLDEEVLEYVKTFFLTENKKKYQKWGIPYKLNLLLEGHPGTGKTSLIFAIASELNMNVAILNFNNNMDDNNFMRAIRTAPANTMLVLEDIDVLFKERKSNDELKNSISFSGLLNSLDGLGYKPEQITWLTTNYECNLDNALIRPGRIDNSYHFDYTNKNQTLSMFNKFFPENTERENHLWENLKNYKYTTAILQQFFLENINDIEGLFNEENINRFSEICKKNDYNKKLDLYM